MTREEAENEVKILKDLSSDERIDWLLEVAQEAWQEGHDSRDDEVKEMDSELDALFARLPANLEDDLDWLTTRIQRGEASEALIIVDRIRKGACHA